MKRTTVFILVLIILMFSTTTTLLSNDVPAFIPTWKDDGKSFKVLVFQGGGFAVLVKDPSKITRIDYIGTSITLHTVLDRETKEIIGVNRRIIENINIENMELMTDTSKMNEFIKESGIEDYDMLRIIESEYFGGYVVCVNKGKSIWYIPLLQQNAEKFSVFENRKVYTAEEYAELCEEKPCDYIIFRETIECDSFPPIIDFGTAWLPLRPTMEALGIEVYWDEEEKKATFSNCSISLDNDVSTGKNIYAESKGSLLNIGRYRLKDGNIFIPAIALSRINKSQNITVKMDFDKHIVEIEER